MVWPTKVYHQQRRRLMRKAVTHSPMSNSKKIQAKLMETATAISTKTIQRRLSLKFGFKSCKPARQSRLTQAMKKKRLDFAKRHRHRDRDFFCL